MPYVAPSALTCGVGDHLDTRWPATTRTPAFFLSKPPPHRTPPSPSTSLKLTISSRALTNQL